MAIFVGELTALFNASLRTRGLPGRREKRRNYFSFQRARQLV